MIATYILRHNSWSAYKLHENTLDNLLRGKIFLVILDQREDNFFEVESLDIKEDLLILVIRASNRKSGKSNQMIDRILKDLNQAYKTYDLNQMKLKGCTGCGACKKMDDFCVIQDDLKAFFDDLKTADRVIFGSPNFMGTINGQMKMVYDRLFCLTHGEKKHKISHLKAGALVMGQGYEDKAYYKEAYNKLVEGMAYLLNSPLELMVCTKPQGEDQADFRAFMEKIK